MKRKILLIEDNGKNRDRAIYLLEHNGYEVIPAANGGLGIEMAIHHRPQLILLDLHLSSMDGASIAHALASHPALQSVPIVAVVPQPDPAGRNHPVPAGCQGLVGKPIDPETFVAEVERHLQPDNRPRIRTGFWFWMAKRKIRAELSTVPSWGA